jgi:hypothetical protein
MYASPRGICQVYHLARGENMSPKYREMLEKNLDYMLSKELDDPSYYGPKIRDLSDRLGI